MKTKLQKIVIIWLCMMSVLPNSFLTGCMHQTQKSETNAQISAENKKEIQQLFAKTDNQTTADNITTYCSVEEFNKYNIKKDTYSRIATAITVLDIEKSIGIPLLRKVNDVYYSVHCIKNSKGDKLYGFIMYRESGTVIDGWLTDKLHTEKDFFNISTGSSISLINKIDPYSCFLENLNENSATSYHTLDNGKEYVVSYERKDTESEYKIVHAHTKNDGSNFTNLLLPVDKSLIAV